MNASSSGRQFMGLYHQRELSQGGARKFVDVVQAARLSSIQLSTSLEIRAQQRSGANCLAIEAIEYRYLLSGGVNGVVTLYDLETVTSGKGKSVVQPLLETVGDTANRLAMISSVQWYPEDTGVFVVSSMSGSMSIFDTNEFVPVVSFAFPNNVVHASRIGQCPNIGTSIAVALQDGTVRLCDPRTRDSSHIFKGHSRAATCVAWDPSAASHLVASAGADGAVRVWDVRKAGGLKEAAVRSLDWRGDFTSNARVNTKKLHTSLLSARGSNTAHGATRIREDHQHFNSASYNTDSSDNSMVGKAHDNGVMSLRYTSCGNYLVTSGNDQKVRLWGAHSGQLSPTNFSDKVVPVSQLPYDIGIAEFSYASSDVLIVPTIANAGSTSDGAGQGGVSTSEGDLLLIPLHCSDGRPVKVLKGHLDRVAAIVYRKPQQQIISAGKDGMIFVWGPPDPHQNSINMRKSRGEADDRRQQRLFYGTTGGRYGYQQVLDSFSAPAIQSRTSAAASSSVGSNHRVLPRNETESRVSAEQSSTSNAQAGAAANQRVAGGDDADGSSCCSSGDDWSDDEAPNACNTTARPGKRKLSAVLRQADGSVAASTSIASAGAGASSMAAQGSSRSTSTAGLPAALERSSRSFVPPIIAHYLQDAQRTTVPRAVSCISSSSGAQVGGATAAAGSIGGGGTFATAASWQDVDSLFTAPSAPLLPSATLPIGQSGISSSGSVHSTLHATAPGRAATAPSASASRSVDDVREADRRYSQWVKQVRGKGKAGISGAGAAKKK